MVKQNTLLHCSKYLKEQNLQLFIDDSANFFLKRIDVSNSTSFELRVIASMSIDILLQKWCFSKKCIFPELEHFNQNQNNHILSIKLNVL